MTSTLSLRETHAALGAKVAEDGIPLQYTDLLTEYRAVFAETGKGAILLDRSHEARMRVTGKDRDAILHRISTNDLMHMATGEGRPTIFTTNTARILDRVMVYAYPDEALTLIGGPGRGAALFNYLQRNIFFRDEAKLTDLSASSNLLSLHGAAADAVIAALAPEAAALAPLHGVEATIAEVRVFLARDKAYSGTHWRVLVPSEGASAVWMALLEAGKAHGLIAAGSLTFNAMRIRAGVPGVGRELSEDYLPLELGLWDEVSFTKGCYTGQEIIARMESRKRLAKTIIALELAQMVNAPADLLHEGRRVGTLTSSVTTPEGRVYGIGVVKPSLASIGQTLALGDVSATITALPGVQPPMLADTE